MTKFLQRGHREYQTSYSLEYHDKDDPGRGFTFPCTKEGILLDGWNADDTIPPNMALIETRGWYKNYLACLNGENNTVFDGIVGREHSWWEPSIIECEGCSAEVVLDHTMINICDCGLEYNMSVQLLLIITNIKPIALIPAKDTWRIKVRRLPNVVKFGAMNENSNTKKTRIRKGTFFFSIDPKLALNLLLTIV